MVFDVSLGSREDACTLFANGRMLKLCPSEEEGLKSPCTEGSLLNLFLVEMGCPGSTWAEGECLILPSQEGILMTPSRVDGEDGKAC